MDTKEVPIYNASAECVPFTLASWYKFIPLDDCDALRAELSRFCRGAGIRGTILLSPEGINGSIAGPKDCVSELLGYLKMLPGLRCLLHRETPARTIPFYRLKIRIKKEIISLGSTLSPGAPVGVPVEAQDWNGLLKDPDVLVLDTRNHYEVGVGTFEGALDPGLGSFREFPRFVRERLDSRSQPRVAMFCTGGIRCEKASSFMLEQGFRELYQLSGGILRYLDLVPEEESLWEGECFVFDQRVSVVHGGAAGSCQQCHTCRHPLRSADRRAPGYEEGVSCPHCYTRLDADRRLRSSERHRQVRLARARGRTHIGGQARF